MKAKKMISVLLAVFLMMSVLAVAASAEEIETYNNHDDIDFTFNFGFFGKSNTLGSDKTDKTGTYIICSQIPSGGFDVFVDGGGSVSGGWTDCTDYDYGKPKLTVTNSGRLISQYVYERGYRFARLGGYKTNASQNAIGKWSPDSQGSYPYL